MQTSCLSGSNKIDQNCSKVTYLRNSERKTSQGMSSCIMLAMWSSSTRNAICLVGLARGSRIWQASSREGRPPVWYRKGRSNLPALVSPPHIMQVTRTLSQVVEAHLLHLVFVLFTCTSIGADD